MLPNCRSVAQESTVEESKQTISLADHDAAATAVTHWQERFAANPDWFQDSTFTKQFEGGRADNHELLQDYSDSLFLFDEDAAIQFQETRGTRESRTRLIGMLIANLEFDSDRVAGLERVNELIGRWDFDRMAVLADASNHAGSIGSFSMLDWIDQQVESIPKPKATEETIQIQFGNSIDRNDIEFLLAGARLELIRRVGSDLQESETRKAEVVELSRKLRDHAAAMFGAASSVQKFKRRAMAFALLESWSYSADVTDEIEFRSIVENPALAPLGEIAARYQWTDLIFSEPASAELDLPELPQNIDEGKLPPLYHSASFRWLERQLHCRRFELAIAYVVQAEGSDLFRARMLAAIANRLATHEVEQATACRNAAQALLAMHKDELAGDLVSVEAGDSRMLLIEVASELAIAFHRTGDETEAFRLANQAIELWRTHYAAESAVRVADTHLLNQLNHHSFGALLNAIAQLKITNAGLPEILVAQIDQWISRSRMSHIGTEVASFSCPVFLRDTIRYVDLSAVVMIPTATKKTIDPSLEEVEFWRHSKHELLKTCEYQKENDSKTSRSRLRKFCLRMARHSVENFGLSVTLEQTKTIDDPAVRMTIELTAILKAFEEQQQGLSPRDNYSPSTITPVELTWMGC